MTDAMDDDETSHGGEELPDGFARVDQDVYRSAGAYADADPKDFEEDKGDWSDDDYAASARRLFGKHPHFGDTAQKRYLEEGYSRFEQHDLYAAEVERHAAGASEAIRFYRHDGRIVPRGFMTIAALELVRGKLPTVDFGRIHVTVPSRPEHVGDTLPPPGELPAALRHVIPAKHVDLRKYCTEASDQRQTSRCAAFAWTHALEMASNIQVKGLPRLSSSYTMLQFQKRQGDFHDFKSASTGGEGTSGTWEPGQTLVDHGTCRHDYWGDNDEAPTATERDMADDARAFRLDAQVMDVQLEEVRKVLTAGSPVQFTMNAGTAFADIGRDGLLASSSVPTGRHGCHSMLLVGYVGNFFIVKNSWGGAFGDRGYCIIPRRVLMHSNPEFTAILLTKPGARKPKPEKPEFTRSERTDESSDYSAEWAAAIAPRPLTSPPPSRATTVPPPNAGSYVPTRPPPSAPAAQKEEEAFVEVDVGPAGWIACPSCSEHTPFAKHCTGCGALLVKKRFCTDCGGTLAEGLNFCEHCGSRGP